MMSLSGSASNTQRRHCKVEEHSFSSQESTNCAVSNCNKNEESVVGSNSSYLIPSEPSSFALQDKSGPLSGSPFFTSIMTKSQVQSPYQLTIPAPFHPFLPSACAPVVLSCQNKSWEMRYYGDRPLRRLDGGWKHFAVENKLKIGDGCVFELMDDKNIRFEVRVLSGQVPELFADSGRSTDRPLRID